MAAAAKIKVRMDRSKYYTTVHGEREPGDPHAGVVFMQDGLPFDGDGVLMDERLSLICSDAEQAHAERLRERAAKAAERKSKPADDEGGDDGEVGEKDPNSVNIEAWLRGEQKVEWFALAAAIRSRYHKGVNNRRNALIFLVEEEKVLPLSQLAPEHAAVLQKA
jgi:hypothetical protein